MVSDLSLQNFVTFAQLIVLSAALAPGDIVPVDFHMIRDDHYTEQLFAEVAQPENSWPQPLEATGWNPTSLPLEGTEDDVFNNGDGGLYWLWDMTWNGTGARP